MVRCYSFPPAGSKDPLIMILGSMPGKVSLQKGQYYGHPQNGFWKIMGDLFGAHPALPYEERLEILATRRIALWESLKCCNRPGSADSDISGEMPNDFNAYLKTHARVNHLFFDGGKAYESFRRLVLPTLKHDLHLTRLPSTSPRHARLTYEEKLTAWSVIRNFV
jgi:double-stranded uracil-DNA glycosylase